MCVYARQRNIHDLSYFSLFYEYDYSRYTTVLASVGNFKCYNKFVFYDTFQTSVDSC